MPVRRASSLGLPDFRGFRPSSQKDLRRQPTLRSQLNQIRLWVRQGRTDAWIAHKLDVSIEQLERFKRDHDLEGEGAAPGRPADPLSVPPPELDELYEEMQEDEPEPPEILVEDEPEPAEERPPRERSRSRSRSRSRARDRDRDDARTLDEDDQARDRAPAGDEDDTGPQRRRRRGRRGGRRRRRPSSYEATFDHGEEGYGLWLDPAVVDNPVYSQHWAGQRAVEVTFAADAITIRRADSGDDADDEASDAGDRE
jgi:hypothetical protein